MRGVYRSNVASKNADGGSSPHARGLQTAKDANRVAKGIIPACAGFTGETPSERPGSTDHPRMRGVYCDKNPNPLLIGGSSPHARGLLTSDPLPEGNRRIIPACAGFTLSCMHSMRE